MYEPFARIRIQRNNESVYLMVRGHEEFVTRDPSRATEFGSVESAAAYIVRHEIDAAMIEEIA